MKKLEFMTEPELSELLGTVANSTVKVCASLGVEKPMFVTLLFNDPRVAQYVCNCHRADVIKAMRECADRLEKQQDIPR